MALNTNILKSLLFLIYFTTTSLTLLYAQENAPVKVPLIPGPVVLKPYEPNAGGTWELINDNIGIAAMHMQLLKNNKVIIFDRADVGLSNITLPGPCRRKDARTGLPDCTAHSIVYDIETNKFRPLYVPTDTWCSSGAVHVDGTLIQTGGYGDGYNKIRLFTPCDDDKCDWVELPQLLTAWRWYATNQILPDGRIIVIGGMDVFTYEFLPKDPANAANLRYYDFPFLRETMFLRQYEDNLYPFVHLMADGNLYIFANQKSIVLDYINNKVLRTYPDIPGGPRNYPSTGSSVLLPIRLPLDPQGGFPLEVMICGGQYKGNSLKANKYDFLEGLNTCGRMVITDANPEWKMENMPMPRVMSDMINLPSGDVLVINGAQRGAAMWEGADDPNVYPLIYKPYEIDPTKRFLVANPTKIPRMYHSTAILLPDGRIMVGGSNPHEMYTWVDKYPTELRLEAFSPDYLSPQFETRRARILTIDRKQVFKYQEEIKLTLTLKTFEPDKGFEVVLISPAFATHSIQMNQKMLVLPIENTWFKYPVHHTIVAKAPATPNIAPPGYYMLFVVHAGIPSRSWWVKIGP
ncbi:hypothetical protein LIER_32917 [Lithospermum erythrorhizon]|uniref:Galactose oxidase n=1 Tax=Lithospermum erythrorhizon TaxID=34254 RepID=A0AAV3RYW9_LITER